MRVLHALRTLKQLFWEWKSNTKQGNKQPQSQTFSVFLQDNVDVEVTVEIKSGKTAFMNLSVSSGKICANLTLAMQYDIIWLAAI